MSQRLHRLVQVTEGLLSQPRARAGAREWGFGSVFTDHLSPWLREREESPGITLDRLYYLWMWECYTTNNVTQVWEHEISWCDSWWWVHSAWDDHYTMSHSTEGEREARAILSPFVRWPLSDDWGLVTPRWLCVIASLSCRFRWVTRLCRGTSWWWTRCTRSTDWFGWLRAPLSCVSTVPTVSRSNRW